MKMILLDAAALVHGNRQSSNEPQTLDMFLECLASLGSDCGNSVSVIWLSESTKEPLPRLRKGSDRDLWPESRFSRQRTPDKIDIDWLDLVLKPISKHWQLDNVMLISANSDWLRQARELGVLSQSVAPEDGRNTSLERAATAVAAFAAPARPADPVRAQLERVCPKNLNRSVHELAAFGSRYAYRPNAVEVQKYLYERLEKYEVAGRLWPQYQPFPLPDRCDAPRAQPQKNVLFGPDIASLGRSNQSTIMICAHYDSICTKDCQPGHAGILAPGANDNATGVAALLELARLCPEPRYTQANIVFAAFGAEEVGIHGSTEAMNIALSEEWPLALVVNLDMIGNNPPGAGNRVYVQYDNDKRGWRGTAVSRACAQLLEDTAEKYTDLLPRLITFRRDSDHVPFWLNGFPALKVEEFVKNRRRRHSSNDLPGTVDYDYLTSVTRMVLAFILRLAEKDLL